MIQDKEERRILPKVARKPSFRRTVKSVDDAYSAFQKRERRVGVRLGLGSKLSQSLIDNLCDSLRLGHFPDFACANVGITPSLFNSWLRRGQEDYERLSILSERGIELREEDYTLHYELYIKVQRALYDSQNLPLTTLQEASKNGEWRAAAFYLERRFSKQWARKNVNATNLKQVNQVNQVQTVIVVPKRADTVAQWDEMVKQRRKELQDNDSSVDVDIVDDDVVIDDDGVICKN